MNIEQMPKVEQSISTTNSGQSNFDALALLKEGSKDKKANDTQKSEMQAGSIGGKEAEQVGDKESKSSGTEVGGRNSLDKSGKENEKSGGDQSQGKGEQGSSLQELIDKYSPENNPDSGKGEGGYGTENEIPDSDSDKDGKCGEDLDKRGNRDAESTDEREEPLIIEETERPDELPEGFPDFEKGPGFEPEYSGGRPSSPLEQHHSSGNQSRYLELSNPYSGQ